MRFRIRLAIPQFCAFGLLSKPAAGLLGERDRFVN